LSDHDPEKKEKPKPSLAPPTASRPIPPAPRPGSLVAGVRPPPTPPAAPRPQAPAQQGRRRFLTLVTVVGGLLSLAPFFPWGEYFSNSIQGSSSISKAQRIVLDNNPDPVNGNGKAAGKLVKVSDLATFPPNSRWVMTFPSSGDPNLDAQNPNTFVKFELIRLPTELGGDQPASTSFVAFSKVCVHLWCSPNYNPQQCKNPSENGYSSATGCETHQLYECPCHGSAYSIPDGVALVGPAAIQPPPTNAIPILTLSMDSSGFLLVEPPDWTIDRNGVLGYGRAVSKKA